MKKRKKGYIYFEKLYVTEDYDTWLKKHNKCLKEENRKEITKGQMAYKGDAFGKVCKVFNEKDFVKFQEGDILVTPMTVPKFIQIMKKASAIITDEGGITCHAAIISRELKIPCIVGCKNATLLLQDGDLISVKAELGTFQKIE